MGEELNELLALRKELQTVEELLASVRSAADVPGVPDVSAERHGRGARRDTVGSLLTEIEDLTARADGLREEIGRREESAAAFIGDIDDAQTRLIFRLRFMRGYTWKRIARTMGGGNTVNGVKMRCARYLKSCGAMLPDVT